EGGSDGARNRSLRQVTSTGSATNTAAASIQPCAFDPAKDEEDSEAHCSSSARSSPRSAKCSSDRRGSCAARHSAPSDANSSSACRQQPPMGTTNAKASSEC